MRVAASVWLTMLASKASRRTRSLLRCIGQHPWEFGWGRLWHNSSLYWIVPFSPIFTSLGALVYVGETDNMHRRAYEHLLRLLAPRGVTQQPFFDIIRGCADTPTSLRASVSEWLFIPVSLVQPDVRKRLERDMIQRVGSLNPPRVYALLNSRQHRKRARSLKLFEQHRPVKRLRLESQCREFNGTSNLYTHKQRRRELQNIAAALSGHKFPGHCQYALTAWRLSPGPWVYVVNRICNTEEGLRRRRGLWAIRLISKRRPDLPSPISRIRCSLPWVGTLQGRKIMMNAIKRLLQHWKAEGRWVPVLRHARVVFSWTRTPSLSKALSSASQLAEIICSSTPPACKCALRQHGPERWTGIVIDGCFHVASPQSCIPWPADLCQLADVPASLTLPPKHSRVVASVRDCLRGLQKRCRVPVNDVFLEDVAVDASQQLRKLLDRFSADFPVSWEEIRRAKHFLNGFYVQYFDHNSSAIGAFCPALVRQVARKLLDLGDVAEQDNFTWSADFGSHHIQMLLNSMANIDGLPLDLQPCRVSRTRASEWRLGHPTLLPKWKAPGWKWRLVIDKHLTPRNALHSLACRGIDAALDSLPRHWWSDCRSVQEVITLSSAFNAHLKHACPQGFHRLTVSFDMVDCFHHLPCAEASQIWKSVCAYWESCGVNCVTVPKRAGIGRARLGKYDLPGFCTMSFQHIGIILSEFLATNYVHLRGFLGREVKGAPMGDALSGAILRLFKFSRERHEIPGIVAETDTCTKILHLSGLQVLVLDVSFRDDLRLFCAWSSQLSTSQVAAWANNALHDRYTVGSMTLERSETDSFVGLKTRWTATSLQFAPCFDDSYARDSPTIKPWKSWAPRAQLQAVVYGMLCRCWYQCNEPEARASSFLNAFLVLRRAGYPDEEIQARARRWALSWKPPGCSSVPAMNAIDVNTACAKFCSG